MFKRFVKYCNNIRKKIQYSLLDFVVVTVVFTFGGLSQKASKRVAAMLVFFTRPFLFKHIKIIDANLQAAFPEKSEAELLALRKQNLHYLAELGLDFLQALKYPERIKLKVEDTDFIKKIRESDQVGIFCTPHMGNWEILIHFLPHLKREFLIIAADLRSNKLNELMQKARSSKGAEVIFYQGATLKVRRALREKKSIGLLIDQNISPKRGGIFVNFFSLPAPTSRLPAALARRENALIVVGACCKNASGEFELILQGLPKNTSEYESDWELTSDIMLANEKLIRQYPEQYLWIHRRWRYAPHNLPDEVKERFPFYATKDHYACEEEMLQAVQEN